MATITPQEFEELMTAYLAEHGSEISGVIPDEEFRQKFMAMLEETGYSEANVTDVLSEIDDSVLMTGVEYSTDVQGNPVTPLRYIRAKMSLFSGNQKANYSAVSSNQSGVTTSLTADGCETKVYYNSGSSAVTVSFATSGLVFVDGNDSMEIPAGGYGEANFLRITTGGTTRVFVRSVVSE